MAADHGSKAHFEPTLRDDLHTLESLMRDNAGALDMMLAEVSGILGLIQEIRKKLEK